MMFAVAKRKQYTGRGGAPVSGEEIFVELGPQQTVSETAHAAATPFRQMSSCLSEGHLQSSQDQPADQVPLGKLTVPLVKNVCAVHRYQRSIEEGGAE